MTFPETLSESLLVSARWNAREAIQHWDSDDHAKALHASTCIGIAAELLLKHLLAVESPALLADLVPKTKEKAFNARRMFASDAYHIGLSDIHSCTADDAFFIHKQIDTIPEVIDNKDFSLQMKVRNAACHLAALSSLEERRDAIHSLIDMFEKSCVDSLSNSHTFQGLETKIEHFEANYRQDRFKLIMEKIKGIRTHMASLAGSEELEQLEAEARHFLWDEAEALFGTPEEGWESSSRPAYDSTKCMICGDKNATLLCEVEGELFDVPDIDTGGAEVFEYGNILLPHAFACGNCGLTLTYRELRVLADKERNNNWAQCVVKPISKRSGHYTNSQGPKDLSDLKEREALKSPGNQ